jgi:hypothetical protein
MPDAVFDYVMGDVMTTIVVELMAVPPQVCFGMDGGRGCECVCLCMHVCELCVCSCVCMHVCA